MTTDLKSFWTDLRTYPCLGCISGKALEGSLCPECRRHKAEYEARRALVPKDVCEMCGTKEGVTPQSSRTAYAEFWLNDDICLCPSCAEEHHAEWDNRWSDYYGGLL